MSLPVLLSPAPGWYPDPAGAATYRWWDGDAWTEGTHPGDAGSPQTTVAPEPRAETARPEHVVFGDAIFEPAPVFERAPAIDDSAFAPLAPRTGTEPAVGVPAAVAGPAPASAPAFTQVPHVQHAPAVQPAPAPGPATASTPVVRRGVSPAKTRWVSILAAYPFVYPFAVAMIVALGYAGGASSNLMTLIVIGGIAALVLLAPAWMLADSDRKELIARGYEPAPSLAWMLLLPPIVYLIARRRVVGPSY